MDKKYQIFISSTYEDLKEILKVEQYQAFFAFIFEALFLRQNAFEGFLRDALSIKRIPWIGEQIDI